MDKFDEILKNAVGGYEAPFDPGMWDKVSSQLNSPFDQAVKDAADGFEAPYNQQAWQNVSRQLGPSATAWKWIGGTAAALTLLIGGAYYLSVDNNTGNSQEEIVSNNNEIIENDLTNNKVILSDESTTSNHGENHETISDETNPELNHIDPIITDIPTVSHPEIEDESELTHPNSVGNDGANGNESTGNNEVTNPENSVTEIMCNANFTCDQIEACAGTEFIFSPQDMNQDFAFVWNFGDGSFSAGKIGTHKFNRAGTYTVTLTLNDKASNKTLKTEKRTVTVHPNPTTKFTWEESDNIIPSVTFINLTDDANQASWEIKGLRSSTANQFSYTFREKGTYLVELMTENTYGCQSTVQKQITIENDYNLLAPTAFSPNGDFKNDEFIPKALLIMNNPEFTMTIHDKAGNLLYQTNNVNQPWDGLITEDNTQAPAGAYIWTVVLKNENGEVEEYQGQVFIVR